MTYKWLFTAGAAIVVASWVGVWFISELQVRTGVERIEIHHERLLKGVRNELTEALTELVADSEAKIVSQADAFASSIATSVGDVNDRLGVIESGLETIIHDLSLLSAEREARGDPTSRDGTDVDLAPAEIDRTPVVEEGLFAETDLLGTMSDSGMFTTFIAAVEAAGLVDTLQAEGPFTVFAPTDEAFAALPEGTLEAIFEDVPTLTAILTHHVLPGTVKWSDLVDPSGNLVRALTAASADGQVVTIGVGITFDGANVVQTDIEASNGVIHAIDSVILPK